MAVAIDPNDPVQQAETRDAWPRITSSPLAPHVEQLVFHDFAGFSAHLRAQLPHWPAQVQQALRLIALNGIVDPIEQQRIPATAVQRAHDNHRETLESGGCLSRHRAVLLVVQELLAQGCLPPREQLDVYCPEAGSPFAARLEALFPRLVCSTYGPDRVDAQDAAVMHQDLCALTLADACMDLVICNELFEHLADLPAALAGVARVLRPNGALVATCRFAYDRAHSLVNDEVQQGDMAASPAERVHQIPGWDLLEQARAAGLSAPAMHWIAAPSYGVVGQEIPAVMVMVARRP